MELWTTTELRAYCRKLGLKVSGTKAVLIDRIIEYERQSHRAAA